MACYFDDFNEGDFVCFVSSNNICEMCNHCIDEMEFSGTLVGHRLHKGKIFAIVKIDEPHPKCKECGGSIKQFMAFCEDKGPNLSAYENLVLDIKVLEELT